MKKAFDKAKIEPYKLDYINIQTTSTTIEYPLELIRIKSIRKKRFTKFKRNKIHDRKTFRSRCSNRRNRNNKAL